MGNLMRIQVDQHKQLIGTERHFLELNSNNFPYDEPSRIQFMWKQNTKYGINIKVNGIWNQELERENDIFIMDKIWQITQSKYILERINDVHLYLKVSRLSNIVNDEGSAIEKWALYGPPANSTLTWPKRRKPSILIWNYGGKPLGLAFVA